MKRPVVNISTPERAARVLVGLLGAVVAIGLLGSGAGGVPAVLEILLALAGLDLLITGAIGHCPLYRRLGHVPRSLGPQA